MTKRIVEPPTPEACEPHAVFDRGKRFPVFFRNCRLARDQPQLQRLIVFAEALSRSREIADYVISFACAAIERFNLLERRREKGGSFSVGVRLECFAAGFTQVFHRLVRERAGTSEVECKLTGVKPCAIAVELLQRLGDSSMHQPRTRAAERRVGHLLKDGVGKVVGSVAGERNLLEDSLRAELRQRCRERVRIELRECRQLIDRESTADDRRDVRDVAGMFAEPVDSRSDSIA